MLPFCQIWLQMEVTGWRPKVTSPAHHDDDNDDAH